MITPGRALVLAALMAAPALAATTVTQSVEPLQIGTEDTAEVTVEVAGARSGAQVSLPQSGDFQVLGRSSSKSTSIRDDGSGEPVVQRTQSYVFRVHPLRQGKIAIPPATVSVDGQKLAGAGAELEVSAGHVAEPQRQRANDPFSSFFGDDPFADMPSPGSLFDRAFGRQAAAPLDARLLVSIDKSSVYAGQQATLSVFLATANNLSSGGELHLPTVDGAASQDIDIGKRLTPRVMTIDGHEYTGFLVARRALFPSRPGALTIPAGSIEVASGGAFDLPQSRTLHSQPLQLTVKPLPPGGRPGEPVGTWRVSMALGTSARPEVGQPLPVQVTFEGTGDLVALPTPTLEPEGQARVLAPTVKDTPANRGGALGGRRAFEFLVTPDAPGTLVIPPVPLDYFDPALGRHQHVTSAALTLEVAPAAVAASSAAPPPPAASVAPAPPSNLEAPKTALMIAGAVGVLALAVLLLVAAARSTMKLWASRAANAGASPTRRAQRQHAQQALADARSAAKSGRDSDAIRFAEQALTGIASSVGLATDALDVDRLAQDPTRPLQAAWAQTLLQCRRARFMTLDSARVAELLDRTRRAIEELPRSGVQPPPHSPATHAG